jgi:large exoprotein involved in heme utilization and adhesion
VLNQGEISAATSGTGTGGEVRIVSDTLSLTGAGSINTSSLNSGHAGNIFITTGEMTLDQGALIFAAPLGPSGDGGDIQIAARDLTLQNGSGIGSSSFGGGVAGSIQLTVSGRCLVDSSAIHAATFGATQGGAAGDIVVQANDLEIRGSGFISTTTYGNGAGGNVNITAATMLLTDTATVSAGAGPGSYGKGGDIVVNAGTLQISQNSYLEAASSGYGPGGAVSIQAGQLQIEGAQPFGVAGIHSFGALSGPAGSIEIQAGQLSLVNGQIECEANQGDAGNITIQSGNSITLANSFLGVQSTSGNAGTIMLSAPGSIVLQNSLVGAFAGLNGGNITIEPQIFGLVDSSLNANALTGNGGHISITADFFYQLGNSSITAISQNLAAQPGTISISSGVEFANVLSVLPIAPLQETSKIREGCARKNPRANSLIVRGKGGVAARPDAFLPLYDLRLEPADQL